MKIPVTYRSFLIPALAITLCATGTVETATARDKPCKRIKRNNDKALWESKIFDVRQNLKSNVDLSITNYGVIGKNGLTNASSVSWPRGSNNMYLFGGGLWFGAVKQNSEGEFFKNTFITYNPNSGISWVVPGRIADGNELDKSLTAQLNNRVYVSTDYAEDGTPTDVTDATNWPIWDAKPGQTPGVDGYAGQYVPNPANRTMVVYPKGPVFLSDEDIFTIYKDTDLNYYEHGVTKARERGYPLGLDIAQTVYTWAEGELKDAVIIHYEIVNRSSDTLRECWVAPAMDFDIATVLQSQAGASNDRVRFYAEDPSLNLAVQWTEGNMGEANKGFGYVGMSFLSSPAVDENGFIRRDKQFFAQEEQLGLQTFRNWVIENDPITDDSRYDFVSAKVKDADDGPGDKRFLMATGPFNFLPGEKARVAVALVFATGEGNNATGTQQDMTKLVHLTKLVRNTYDATFASGVITRVADATDGAVQAGIHIDRVFPNPASTRMSVEFTLPVAGETTIELVDVTGRTVGSMHKALAAGAQVLALDASAFPLGIYYCRITSAGFTATTMVSIVR